MTHRNAQSTLWTPERIEQMTAMWMDGKSASLCAMELGDDFSRNAVIGKVCRLGLQRGEGPRMGLRPPPRRRRARAKPSAPKRLPFDRPQDVDADWNEWRAIEAEMPVREYHSKPRVVEAPDHAGTEPVTIADLRLPIRQCRHIDGKPTHDALYCGAAVQPGSSYCPHHHARMWRPRLRRAA